MCPLVEETRIECECVRDADSVPYSAESEENRGGTLVTRVTVSVRDRISRGVGRLTGEDGGFGRGRIVSVCRRIIFSSVLRLVGVRCSTPFVPTLSNVDIVCVKR